MSDHLPETPDQFLETEEILQELILELETYKSTSEQLTLAGENVGELLRSCDRLATLYGQLIERNKQQLEATVTLAADTEKRTNIVLEAQQASAALTEETLNTLATTLATQDKGIDEILDKLAIQGEQVKSIEGRLQNEIAPPLQHVQSIASSTRLFTLLLLILTLVNGALAAYILRLLSS